MVSKNHRKTISFVCPSCLAEFRFSPAEFEALAGSVPRCDFCMIPLARIREGR